MIERMDDTTPGVIGLRASGKLSKDDYVNVLEPALQEGVAGGEVRLLFLLTGFDGLEPGAWTEDAKTGLKTIVRDHSEWKRLAFVTDSDWVAKGMRAFAWMAPGEVKVFDPDDLEQAKSWVAD